MTPRTIIVKERVKEERTYTDARGYLVCEEVWVEREVEREMPAAPPKSSASQGLVRERAPPKPQPALGKGGAKGPRGMDSIDAEELAAQNEKKKGGKGKAAAPPVKVKTGAGSILGFFGKK